MALIKPCMIIKIIGSMRHFKLSDLDKYNLAHIDVSSDHQIKKANFINKDFQQQFGLISELAFNENWCFAYTILDDELNRASPDIPYYQYILATHVDRFIDITQSFDSFLWYVKDNSCSSSEVFGQGFEKGTIVFAAHSTGGYYSNSIGEFEDVEFSRDDLNKAITILNKFHSISSSRFREPNDKIKYEDYQNKPSSDFIHKADDKPELYSEFNRLERALKFLHNARSSHYLPHKIGMYIPILECLFSTDAAESTQKISERVAFYLSKENDIRQKIFNTVNVSYNLRSRYLHGGTLDKKQRGKDYQMALSKELDNLIRVVMVKVIMEDSNWFINENENVTTKFLKELIFS